MFVLPDLVKATSTTTGAGALAVNGSTSGFRHPSAVLGNGDLTLYFVRNAAGTEWECGLGTWNAPSNELQRTSVHDSSNSGAAVNFGAGTKTVYVSPSGKVLRAQTSIVPQMWGAKNDGVTDCTAAFNAALAYAGALQPGLGAEVFVPPGVYVINGSLDIPYGVTLRGACTGQRGGNRIFNGSLTCQGTMLLAPTAGNAARTLITMRMNSTIQGFEIYYPDQRKNLTGGLVPIVYGPTINIPANEHWVSIRDMHLANPYEAIRIGVPGDANGTLIENVIGFPIYRGVRMGRCGDVVTLNNVRFNPGFAFDTHQTLKDWTKTNGDPFIIDGPEEFWMTGCGAFGYRTGILIEDLDGDSFRGVYGSATGVGFDQCGVCVYLAPACPLSARGLRLSNMGMIPVPSGAGIKFSDNVAAGSFDQHPTVMATNISFHQFGGNYDRAIWMDTNSNGVCMLVNSTIQNTGQGALVQSAAARVHLTSVAMATGITRISNAVGATTSDVNPITI